MQGQGGLSGHLRAEDLGDAAAWDATHPQGYIQGKGTGGHYLYYKTMGDLPQAHDGPPPELLLDLTYRQV
jgi:hypothetical protein